MSFRIPGLAAAMPLSAVALAYLALPLILLLKGSEGTSAAGFARGFSALAVLTGRSLAFAVVPAILAAGLCTGASLLGAFQPRFARFYRGWLMVMLFTNPVFLVFGFSILLAAVQPDIAVLLATTYILMPFCGQIVQAAADEFDSAQAHAARSLGASTLFIAVRHILPFIRQQVLTSTLFGTLYALGFFLVPAFVGLGHVVTLGTVIYGVANVVGDWTAACQLCIVAISAQIALVALVPVTDKLMQSSRSYVHRYPEFLPDGRHLLFTVGSQNYPDGIYVGSVDGMVPERVLQEPSSATYVPSKNSPERGYLFFEREHRLLAQPFDAAHWKTMGEVFPVVEGIGISGNTQHGDFSASKNGSIVYGSGRLNSDTQLVWIDRSGRRLNVVGQPGAVEASLSPSGNSVAYVLQSGGDRSDVWVWDLLRGVASRVTFSPGISRTPVWSPDGKSIAYQRSRETLLVSLSGSGVARKLFETGDQSFPMDWSSDGRVIALQQRFAKTMWDLWLLPVDGNQKPIPYLQSQYREQRAQFSPDGKWITYDSDEAGEPQVYIQSVPPGKGKLQISATGGAQARWRSDGKELYYLADDRKLMAVTIRLGDSIEIGKPTALFEMPPAYLNIPDGRFEFQPTRDGQKFLVTAPLEGAPSEPLSVVLNWQAGLKK